MIQLKFAEKFVSQGFTIRAAPGLSGPANTCGVVIQEKLQNYKKTKYLVFVYLKLQTIPAS